MVLYSHLGDVLDMFTIPTETKSRHNIQCHSRSQSYKTQISLSKRFLVVDSQNTNDNHIMAIHCNFKLMELLIPLAQLYGITFAQINMKLNKVIFVFTYSIMRRHVTFRELLMIGIICDIINILARFVYFMLRESVNQNLMLG
jgi:hypothetical protein